MRRLERRETLGRRPPHQRTTAVTARATMLEALRRYTVPALREQGFKGSMPHFHRSREDGGTDLLSVQFSGGGGRYTVEASCVGANGENLLYAQTDIPRAKLRASATKQRLRLGGTDEPGSKGDHWFVFDPALNRRDVDTIGEPDALALRTTELLRTQAEEWWCSFGAAHDTHARDRES